MSRDLRSAMQVPALALDLGDDLSDAFRKDFGVNVIASRRANRSTSTCWTSPRPWNTGLRTGGGPGHDGRPAAARHRPLAECIGYAEDRLRESLLRNLGDLVGGVG